MSSLILKFSMYIIFIYVVVCTIAFILHIKKKYILRKPSRYLIVTLFFQISVLVLFYKGFFAFLNETIINTIWWGSVVAGVIFGLREFKKNIIVSGFSVLMSVFLAGLMIVISLITSM